MNHVAELQSNAQMFCENGLHVTVLFLKKMRLILFAFQLKLLGEKFGHPCNAM